MLLRKFVNFSEGLEGVGWSWMGSDWGVGSSMIVLLLCNGFLFNEA